MNKKKNSLDNINAIHRSIREKIAQGILLSYSDIQGLGSAFEEDNEPVLFIFTSFNGDSKSPSVSFLLKEQIVTSFSSTQSMVEKQSELLGSDPEKYIVKSTRHYRVLTKHQIEESILTKVGNIFDLFYENSIIKINIDNDNYDSLRNHIEKSLSGREYSGLKGITSYIQKITGLNSIIAMSEIESKEVELNFLDSETLLLEEVLLLLGVNDNIKNQSVKSGLSLKELLDKSNSLPFREKLWSEVAKSIHFRKAISIDYPRDNSGSKTQQIMVFPILTTRLSSEIDNSNSNNRSFAHALLFISSNVGFRKKDIDAIKLIQEIYIERKSLQFRLKTLEESRRKLDELSPRFEYDDVTYTSLLNKFKKFSEWLFDQSLNSTNAHSITVRLYNHSTKSLELLAIKSTGNGSYKSDVSARHIPVKENRKKSINACVFTRANNMESDYIYIPVIDSKISDSNNEKPPRELSLVGMSSFLKYRENTRSGICFPIRYHSIAVGTVNIESSLPYAFNELIIFFSAVRDILSEAYRRTIAYNDIRTLSRQVSNQAAIHELDQGIKLDIHRFNSTQTSYLKSLFDLRGITNSKPNLRLDINKWVTETYNRLDEEHFSNITNLVQIKSLDEDRVSKSQYGCILFIVKNLIQNVTTHGNPEPSDMSSIIIDDRPLYGIGTNDIIRISSKQKVHSKDLRILDQIGIRPIESASGLRHGMLLISMLSKSLGGQIFIGREASDYSECLIKIPYSKNRNKKG